MVSSQAPVERHVTVRLPLDPAVVDRLDTDGEGHPALVRQRVAAVVVHEVRQQQRQAECVSPITAPARPQDHRQRPGRERLDPLQAYQGGKAGPGLGLDLLLTTGQPPSPRPPLL